MNLFQIFDRLKKKFNKESQTNSYECGVCGKFHAGLPMDMAYKNPANFFKIPPNERSARINSTDDICVIDNKEFYIRGILPIPVIDSNDEFRWGVWARVEEDDFKNYLQYWDGHIPKNAPSLNGYLSGGIKDYPDSDMVEVQIHLQPDDQRPIFRALSSEHQLGFDQQNGVTMEKVHSFVLPLL